MLCTLSIKNKNYKYIIHFTDRNLNLKSRLIIIILKGSFNSST